MSSQIHSQSGITNLGIVFVFSIILFVATNPAFADRSVTFEKIVDVNKNAFQESITDLKNLPKIFPNNVESVESLRDGENAAAMVVFGLNGFSINSEVEVTKEQEKNILQVVSGGLKGTKLTTTLQETWGFDGTPNQGTVVKINMILQTSGFLSLIGLASDDSITYSLDRSLVDIVSYVKSSEVSQQDEQKSDEKEPKPKFTKRKHR